MKGGIGNVCAPVMPSLGGYSPRAEPDDLPGLRTRMPGTDLNA
jgi:hypothetical protein